jgi:hypothetical protein
MQQTFSENFHKMGSFLISKIDGVWLTVNQRSVPTHDSKEGISLSALAPKVGEEVLCFSEEAQGWLP